MPGPSAGLRFSGGVRHEISSILDRDRYPSRVSCPHCRCALAAVVRRGDQRRTLEAVLLGADTPVKLEAAIGHARNALRKMPDDFACRTLVGLGRQLAEQGKWNTACEMYLLASDRNGTLHRSERSRAVAGAELRQRGSPATIRHQQRQNSVIIQVGGPQSTKLTGRAFTVGTTWGMNVTRMAPGVGRHTWSGPVDATPRPEGLGLMQFHKRR